VAVRRRGVGQVWAPKLPSWPVWGSAQGVWVRFRPQFFGSGLVVVAWRLTYSLSGGRKAGKGGKQVFFFGTAFPPFTTFFLGRSKKYRVRFFDFNLDLDSFLSRL
jgi:hypothetical protein